MSAVDDRHVLYAHMFIEDVSLGVMPYRRGGESGYSAEIIGDASEVTRTEILLRSIQRHDSYDTNELVSETVRNIAQLLAFNGVAAFEILRSDDETPAFNLFGFTTRQLFKLPGYWLQFVPKRDRELWGGRAWNVISASDVWMIRIPESLGGYSRYRRLLARLGRFSGVSSRLTQKTLNKEGRQNFNFDFSLYRREEEIYRRRASRIWGWSHRDLQGDDWTEFESIYRLISFRRSQAILREHIVEESNVLLKRLGVSAEIEVKGVASPAQLLALRNQLLRGNATFKDVMDQIYGPGS